MDPRELQEKQKAVELLKKDLHGFRCPVCRRDEFVQVDIPEKDLETQLVSCLGGEVETNGYTPTFSIACTHCGKIEQFAQYPLIQRVRADTINE